MSFFIKNMVSQKGPPFFIYVAQFSPGRGIEICLKIFSGLINARIVFMGFGELSINIEDYARQYSNIHLHEPVAYE